MWSVVDDRFLSVRLTFSSSFDALYMIIDNNDCTQFDIDSVLDKFLPHVSKPSRYMGGEPNSVHKDISYTDVSVALAFPDVYEVGMSNLGLRILYHILNSDSKVSAERVFAPAEDMEKLMREHGVPLFTLESRRPLRCFDVVGFSLAYELSYTAMLNMLDLGGIALHSSQRVQGDPIVIAGGHCTSNPEPVADFVDAFVVGDGEDVVQEIVQAVRASGGERARALELMAQISGVYVPVVHSNADRVKKIRGRAVQSLEAAPFPDTLIVPHTEAVHDRVVLEVMRGCTRGCRFCQAGMLTRPVRERSLQTLCRQAEELIRRTGYDEIALSSLSSADYSRIGELVETIIDRYENQRVGVSLPSLRADAECVKLAADIQRVRKSGLTFAPEAGSQRLRDVINKNVTREDLLGAVDAAVENGWNRVKLYFMVGLPTETEQDIIEIAELIHDVLNTAKKRGVKLTVSVTISTFVPKPHTPFQWHAMPSVEELEQKIALLRSHMHKNNVLLSWHDPAQSRVEAALARGGREVGKAVFEAWSRGANLGQTRFDAGLWENAFTAAGLDMAVYANREHCPDETLPWEHIDVGVSKQFLLEEYTRALAGAVTPDCRFDGCMACGVEDCIGARVPGDIELPETDSIPVNAPKNGAGQEKLAVLRFSKNGRAKWLGHLDLVRAFDRAVRISDIDVVYSEGFNPRPRIALLAALPLGATANEEVVCIRLRVGDNFIGIINALNAALPEGVRVYNINTQDSFRPPAVTSLEFLLGLKLPAGYSCADVEAAIENIMSRETIEVSREKKGRSKVVDLRKGILLLQLDSKSDQERCEVALGVLHGDFTPRPSEIVELIGQSIPGVQLVSIHRNRVALDWKKRMPAENDM